MAPPPKRPPATAQRLLDKARRLNVLNKPAGWRPQTRADCKDIPRPCPFVGCRYNITLDITPTGSVRWRQDDNWEQHFDGRDNCALDVAARGPHTLQEIADITGVCRERVRQELDAALDKIRPALSQATQVSGIGHVYGYDASPEEAGMALFGLDPKSQDDRAQYRKMAAALGEEPA